MAAKSWKVDFRYPAILASLEVIKDGYVDEPFRAPGSFCIPITDRPAMRWSPGKLMLVFLVLGFGGLIAGATLASMSGKPGANETLLLTIGVFCSLSGFSMFFVPLKCDRWIIGWFLGERGRLFCGLPGMTHLMCAEISKADSTAIAIDGDDYALIAFDEQNHRVLMEGVAARYQIRAEDVEWVEPYEFMNYIGAEVSYRINDAISLRLAVARPSLLKELVRQAPILFFLKPLISQKIYRRFAETLQNKPTP